MVKNLHAITVKFYSPTNNVGSRIGIISERFKQRIVLNKDYKFDRTIDQAILELEKRGFNIVAKTTLGNLDVILTDTFEPLK